MKNSLLINLKKIIDKTPSPFNSNYPLILILLFAAMIRLPGIFHGLPVYVMPSEYEILSMAADCLKGDFIPEWISYGGLYYYVNAIIIGVVKLIFHTFRILGLTDVQHTPFWLFYAASRTFNILFYLGIVYVVFSITKLAIGKHAAIYASISMTLFPLAHKYSLQISPDIFVVTMTSFSMLFTTKYLLKNNNPHYLYWAALFAGLSISAKFMVISIIPLCIAKLLVSKKGHTHFFDKTLLISSILVILSFIVTSPFSVLAFRQYFIDGLLYAHNLYQGDFHPGIEQQNLVFSFLSDLFKSDITPGLFVSASIGLPLLLFTHRDFFLILYVGPLLWFCIMSVYNVDFTYNLIILLVPLSISIGYIFAKINNSILRIILFTLVCIHPLVNDISSLQDMRKRDIRYAVSEWVNANIPPNSHIAWEDHLPFFSSNRFTLTHIGRCKLAHLKPEEIVAKNVDYLISNFHHALLHKPNKYASLISGYHQLIDTFELVRKFEPKDSYRGHTILILKIKPRLCNRK